jgi:hypothetical protein
LSGGASRFSLATIAAPSNDRNHPRDKRVAFDVRAAHCCSKERNRPPGEPVAFGSENGAGSENGSELFSLKTQIVLTPFHVLYISFAGMVTYKKSHELRAVAATIPDDRILIETDAPYLSPHPKRGQRPNEPALVVHTAVCLAETRGQSLASFAELTTANANRLFHSSQNHAIEPSGWRD